MNHRPLAHHVMCRLEDSRVIAAAPAERRVLAHAVADTIPRQALLAFNVADTHLHLELALSRPACRSITRQLLVRLHYRLQLTAPFQRARLKEILDQHHLANTFDHIMRQGERHGLPPDPFHEGSLLPDLLGLRVLLPLARGAVRAMLPRIGPTQWVSYLGVDEFQLSRCPPIPRACSAEDLVAAAVRAAGCRGPQGRSRRHTAMRRALMAATGSTFCTTALAPRLGVTARALRYLCSQPAEPALVRAILLQLQLHQRLELARRRESPA